MNFFKKLLHVKNNSRSTTLMGAKFSRFKLTTSTYATTLIFLCPFEKKNR
eukprot:TRINITY_DN3538_c4_g1_i1.p1 TRINITY_DN3538_c4_g1~~TRINITY_DN3538_c4_g1_i1.p1  ORF type:complete len:50 (-),score=2.76 TRINITY_DN3538_c4_g1_i1:10-159(-)